MAEEGKEGLQNAIKKWLKDTGFPLEMKAADVFREQGYEVRQSFVVKDMQEDKPREIDVIANYPYELDRGFIRITCILECKSSKQPWLVFQANDVLSGYNKLHAFAVMSDDARAAFVDVLFKNKERYKPNWQYFNDTTKCGYALRQPLTEKDTAFTAAMNVLKAARNTVQPRHGRPLHDIDIAFPIIVVDSPIFECQTVDDEINIKEVTHSSFLFSSYIPDYTGCRMHIVHIDHLDKFAKYYANVSTAIRELLSGYEDDLMKKLQGAE